MLDRVPPIAFISSGKVYRKDDDATHLPMFHQVEGIYVSEDISQFKRYYLQNCFLLVW